MGSKLLLLGTGGHTLPAVVSTIKAADTFTRADNTGSAGTMETGGAVWGATGSRYTWGISSNQLYLVGGGAGSGLLLAEHADVDALTNFYVQAKLATINDGHTSIIFRAVDGINHWLAIGSSGGNVGLYYGHTAAGTYTLAASAAGAAVAGDTIRAEVRGNEIKVLVNGVLKITHTSATYAAGRKFGTYSNNTTCRFDNYEVGSL